MGVLQNPLSPPVVPQPKRKMVRLYSSFPFPFPEKNDSKMSIAWLVLSTGSLGCPPTWRHHLGPWPKQSATGWITQAVTSERCLNSDADTIELANFSSVCNRPFLCAALTTPRGLSLLLCDALRGCYTMSGKTRVVIQVEDRLLKKFSITVMPWRVD